MLLDQIITIFNLDAMSESRDLEFFFLFQLQSWKIRKNMRESWKRLRLILSQTVEVEVHSIIFHW